MQISERSLFIKCPNPPYNPFYHFLDPSLPSQLTNFQSHQPTTVFSPSPDSQRCLWNSILGVFCCNVRVVMFTARLDGCQDRDQKSSKAARVQKPASIILSTMLQTSQGQPTTVLDTYKNPCKLHGISTTQLPPVNDWPNGTSWDVDLLERGFNF